jgi:NAD(P)H-hydrate epimerase
MQACDRLTAERFGVPSLELMRAAAAATAEFARERFPAARRVTVLCGRGNNGGDGMMAARLLASAGLRVTTLLLWTPQGLAGDAAIAWRELNSPLDGPANGLSGDSRHGTIHIVVEPEELARHNEALEADLIVDAVVGSGFKPPLKGMALAALEWLQASSAPILAIDVPSGWPADATAATIAGPVFPADAVITFTAPKPAHVFGQLTRRWDQPVVAAPIGSPEAAIAAAMKANPLAVTWAGSALTLEPRAPGSNKGNFGHVLVVGGTFGTAGGKAGAPAMTALAAMRAGAGLVTAAVPAPAMALTASVAPELMTFPLAVTAAGEICAENLAAEALTALLATKTVLAIGPGMGQSAETAKFVAGLLLGTTHPAVIDADALNILAAEPELLAKLGEIAKKGRTLALTPHPGEMARLAGLTVAEVQANRLEVSRGFAAKYGVTLVLKGARTLIAHPDGRVAVNTTGNPGMAKGGSGDLLTGLIAGLLAQYPVGVDSSRAIEAAVYLHGLAGDFAARAADERTVLATDSLGQLARAFRFQPFGFRPGGSSGYLWLQGMPAESSTDAASREETP